MITYVIIGRYVKGGGMELLVLFIIGAVAIIIGVITSETVDSKYTSQTDEQKAKRFQIISNLSGHLAIIGLVLVILGFLLKLFE